MLYTIWRFYEVRRGDRTTFEISALIGLEYWGDAKLPEWKARWDYMVANLRTPLGDLDLEAILLAKLRKSESTPWAGRTLQPPRRGSPGPLI